jgi:hypothetical protein
MACCKLQPSLARRLQNFCLFQNVFHRETLEVILHPSNKSQIFPEGWLSYDALLFYLAGYNLGIYVQYTCLD